MFKWWFSFSSPTLRAPVTLLRIYKEQTHKEQISLSHKLEHVGFKVEINIKFPHGRYYYMVNIIWRYFVIWWTVYVKYYTFTCFQIGFHQEEEISTKWLNASIHSSVKTCLYKNIRNEKWVCLFTRYSFTIIVKCFISSQKFWIKKSEEKAKYLLSAMGLMLKILLLSTIMCQAFSKHLACSVIFNYFNSPFR